MKKNIFNIVSIIIAVIFLAACSEDFLTKRPLGSVDRTSVKSKAGVEVLTIGAYSSLNPQHAGWGSNPNNWIYGSICGGDAYKGSEAGDQPDINAVMTWATQANNGYTNDKWNWAYNGIFRCNDAISIINSLTIGGDIDASFISLKTAELRFLRGFYYFELTRMFGPKVPWVDDKIIDKQINNPNVPNDKDITPEVQADFQFAADNLPETWSDVGRINSWGAKAMLAKHLLFQHKYAEAKVLYDAIITNGKTTKGLPYKLQTSFDQNFNVAFENSSESVFAVQNDIADGSRKHGNPGYSLAYPYGNDAPGGCCGFFQPSQSLVNSFKVDALGLPLFNTFNQTNYRSDDGYAADSVYISNETTAVDPRLDWTVGRRGSPYTDWGLHPGKSWIRDQAYAGPFSPLKNVYRKNDPNEKNDWWAPGSALNIDLIRFADVLLMAAECEIEVGSLEKAREYVNLIRDRAGKSNSWDLNYDRFASKKIKTQAEYDVLNLPGNNDMKVGEYIIREDLNNVIYALVKLAPVNPNDPADKTTKKFWSIYSRPNYFVSTYATPWTDKALAGTAVRFERKIELAMEGHRFFDLSRWGNDVAKAEIEAYAAKEKARYVQFQGIHFDVPCDLNYPIPLQQMELGQGVIIQNGSTCN